VPGAGKESERFFAISVVARMLNVHQQTLRIYEREGLIKPARSRGNTRLYTEKDIEDIKIILRLTNELGVNLAGVGVILELQHQMEKMEAEYEKKMHLVVETLTRHFYDYLQNKSCLPVVSVKRSLIIHQKGNIDTSQ